MATISLLPNNKSIHFSGDYNLESEDCIKSIMNVYIFDVLPVIDKFYQAVANNDYKTLPALSLKLRPYFQAMGLNQEPLENMEHPENLKYDHRNIQKLYFSIKSLCETGIDKVKAQWIVLQRKNISTLEE
jgi:hypothetical protein